MVGKIDIDNIYTLIKIVKLEGNDKETFNYCVRAFSDIKDENMASKYRDLTIVMIRQESVEDFYYENRDHKYIKMLVNYYNVIFGVSTLSQLNDMCKINNISHKMHSFLIVNNAIKYINESLAKYKGLDVTKQHKILYTVVNEALYESVKEISPEQQEYVTLRVTKDSTGYAAKIFDFVTKMYYKYDIKIIDLFASKLSHILENLDSVVKNTLVTEQVM